MNGNDLIIDIENGIPFMVQRPINCPKIVIKIYDVESESVKNSWVIKGGQIHSDKNGKKYIEITWG